MNAKHFGPIALKPGVGRGHVVAFIFFCLLGIPLSTFVGFIQPYVLTHQLDIPGDIQGKVTGDLVFYSEFVLLSFALVAGVMADRLGRRTVLAIGFAIVALGYLCYGFVTSYWELLALRFWFAVGISCVSVMVTTLMADLPMEHSRGKLVSLGSFFIGCGSIFMGLVLAKLPSIFTDLKGEELAGIYSFFTVSAIAVFLLLTALAGAQRFPREITALAQDSRGFMAQAASGVMAARHNLRVALAYAAAFVSRGDLIVIGTFYSLWLQQEGIMRGMSTAEAIKTAGIFFVVVQTTALLWAPVAGILSDRLDRVLALAISLALAAVGYGAMGVVDDPLGTQMYVGAVLLGIGQMGVVISCQTLVGQEAPDAIRGNVMGVFTLFGALGILVVSKAGGAAFDLWQPAPFVIVAGANLLLLTAAIALRNRQTREIN